MGRQIIGRLFNKLIVTGNKKDIRPSEYYAELDKEGNDIVSLQVFSKKLHEWIRLAHYVTETNDYTNVITDKLPADSGSDASGGAVVGSPITVYIPNNAKKGYKPGLLQGKCYSSVGIDRSGSLPLLNVTANGTYEIDDDYLFGYTKVEVNVPTGSDAEVTYDAATENLSITGVSLTVG